MQQSLSMGTLGDLDLRRVHLPSRGMPPDVANRTPVG